MDPVTSSRDPGISPSDIFLIFISWISFLVYINLIYLFVTRRKTKTILRTPFYKILVWNALIDSAMFIYLEFVIRPWAYRIIELHPLNSPKFIFYSFGFLTYFLRNAMNLNYVLLTCNRFTAIIYPFQHNRVWTTRHIRYSVVFVWLLASILAVTSIVLDNSSEAHLLFLPAGVVRLGTGNVSTHGILIPTILAIVSCSVIFVIYYVIVFKGLPECVNIQVKTTATKRVLCCMFISIPLFVEGVKAVLLIFGYCLKDYELLQLANEMGFYSSQIELSFHCWPIVLAIPTARNLLIEHGVIGRLFCLRNRGSLVSDAREERILTGINSHF